jgi:hypothetical protein
VRDWVVDVVGLETEDVDRFAPEKIDGRALLLMTLPDLMADDVKMKRGPAKILLEAVSALKNETGGTGDCCGRLDAHC